MISHSTRHEYTFNLRQLMQVFKLNEPTGLTDSELYSLFNAYEPLLKSRKCNLNIENIYLNLPDHSLRMHEGGLILHFRNIVNFCATVQMYNHNDYAYALDPNNDEEELLAHRISMLKMMIAALNLLNNGDNTITFFDKMSNAKAWEFICPTPLDMGVNKNTVRQVAMFMVSGESIRKKLKEYGVEVEAGSFTLFNPHLDLHKAAIRNGAADSTLVKKTHTKKVLNKIVDGAQSFLNAQF